MSKVNVKYTPAAKMMERAIAHQERKELKFIKEQEDAKYKEYLNKKESDRLMSIGENVAKSKTDYYEFIAVLKKSLLDEAINKIFIQAIPIEQDIIQPDSITFAESYTSTNGVQRTINEFKRATPLLSSIALLIEETEDKILDKVVKGDESTYNVDPEDLIDFNKALDDESVRDMSDIIKDRVQITVDDFIEKNQVDKLKHMEIVEKSKEKIGKTSNEEIAEDLLNEATRSINAIYNSRPFSIFEGMVRKISESSYTDKDLRDIMISENGSLDMNSIMETAITMYTFLETLNTANMKHIDDEYLKDLYVNL